MSVCERGGSPFPHNCSKIQKVKMHIMQNHLRFEAPRYLRKSFHERERLNAWPPSIFLPHIREFPVRCGRVHKDMLFNG
ncbi:hypothetical protein D3C71_1015540 [compost metagenome]